MIWKFRVYSLDDTKTVESAITSILNHSSPHQMNYNSVNFKFRTKFKCHMQNNFHQYNKSGS